MIAIPAAFIVALAATSLALGYWPFALSNFIWFALIFFAGTLPFKQ